MLGRLAPGGNLAGTHLGARRVVKLHPRTSRCGWAGQSFSDCREPPWNLSPPERQILGNLERDRHELDATDVSNQLGKLRLPATGLTRKHGLQYLPLALIRTLVDKEAQRDNAFAVFTGPGVALELCDADDVQPVEPDVTVRPLSNMIGEVGLTLIVGRRLCELTRTGYVARTDVKPVALQPPIRDVSPSSNSFEATRPLVWGPWIRS